MSEGAAVSIVVVCEGLKDQQNACGLADRVICAEVDWITPEVVDAYRQYSGLEPNACFLKWSAVPARTRRTRHVGIHGHFADQPGEPDAAAARRVLRCVKESGRDHHAVLLIRDTDGDQGRVKGLNQARDIGKWAFQVIIGAAHPKRECWVLAGFEPLHETEDNRLAGLGRELGFDPREKAEQLSAQQPNAKRNAKRVLYVLTQGSDDRAAACWEKTPLSTLEARGQRTGLTNYLDELRTRLAPLLARPEGKNP